MELKTAKKSRGSDYALVALVVSTLFVSIALFFGRF